MTILSPGTHRALTPAVDAATPALRSRGVAASFGRRLPTEFDPHAGIQPTAAGPWLAHLGFLASPDLPDRPGPAYLLVALRDTPTLRHYDPETIEYWTSRGERGVRQVLTRATPVPLATEFSWGLLRIVDRLGVSNEYLTFGGRLLAARVDDAVIATFTSEVPLLRRGGHSQAIDPGADAVGAFFGRWLLAIDYVPGFEQATAEADPVTRYAAFLVDAVERYGHGAVRDAAPELGALLVAESRRVRAERPTAWTEGAALRARMAEATAAALGKR
jgi:hypothetical protein